MVIKRSLYPKIRAHLSNKEITIIAGPRQAGKTFLLRQLQSELDAKKVKTTYFNLDIEEHKKYFISQQALINKIQTEFGKSKGVIFIDEVQRKTDAGLFLKGLYDLDLPYKFVVSGSGSLELKEKIHESLAGRKRVFYLSTVTFKEFLNYKTEYRYETRLTNYFKSEKDFIKTLLVEYLTFGGYPKVVLTDNISAKTEVIKDIYQSYIEKDIALLLKLEKTEGLSQLLRLLADQNGNLVNQTALAQITGLSLPTIKNYLWYLEKTFIIKRIPPFTQRTGREISKSPVVYFWDIGMRNFINNTFGENLRDSDLGFNFQTLVFHLLQEQAEPNNSKVFYWRTKDGAEVDFVVQNGRIIKPIEAKTHWGANLPLAMINFTKKYHSENGKLITFENLENIL